MSNPIPSALSLTNVADGAKIIASDHRNNYSAIQTAVNGLIVALSGGTSGQVLSAVDATDVQWLNGSVRTLQRYTGTPIVNITGSAAESDLFGGSGSGYSLAGGVLGTASAVQIRVQGDLLNSTGGSGSFTFKAYYGASSVTAETVTLASTSANRNPFDINLQLSSLGASNSQLLSGQMSAASSTINPLMFPNASAATGIAQGVFAIDSTAAQNLRVTVTNGSGSGSLACRSYVAQIIALT